MEQTKSLNLEESNTNWLYSEQSKNLLLMVEDDIFENGNFIQRLALFENVLSARKIPEAMFLSFWIIGFVLIYSVIIGIGYIVDNIGMFMLLGFFVSMGLGLLFSLFINSWSGIHYLIYKSAIKKAAKRFATPDEFASFLVALNLVYRHNPYYVDEPFLKKEIANQISACYEGIRVQYKPFSWGANSSKNALGTEFNKMFRNVKYLNPKSFRAKEIKNQVDKNGFSAQNAIISYFRNNEK